VSVTLAAVTFPVKVGALVTVTFGVVPPEDATLPLPVTAVTQVVQAMFGVVPPVEVTGPVAVTAVTLPEAVSQADPVVVSSPPAVV